MSKATTYARRLWYLPVVLFTLACVLAMPGRLAAQNPNPVLDENASGTYYIVAFPDTTSNALDSRYPNTRVRSEATLWIFSAVKNKVKITSNGGASTTLSLEAGKFKVYQIPGSIVCDISGSPVAKSLAVTSDYPIVVYCYWANIQSVEAWTPIPVEQWGTLYYAACVPGEVVKEIGVAGETEVPETPKPGNAEVLVIAAYDNTTVTLTPPPGTNFDGGAAHTVTLNEGQVYQVQSRVDPSPDAENQEDLGGTIITSDKPVGVLSGNTRVQIVVDEVGLKNNAYKNMLMEWIAPVEQHGKEFAYMGTYDSHRPGIGAAAERKREFVRVYNTLGKPTTGYFLQQGGTTQVSFKIKRDTLFETPMGTPNGTYFRTNDPAQVVMHSSAIVQFNGSTPCFRGIPCLSYSAWAPYMVDLAPREQWPTFAPYYAPANPGGMQHYIDVVTDTLSTLKIINEKGSTFLFNRRIPGTDLIWGSMSVSQGEDHWLMGKDGAKFWGFVYGVASGGEEYRPGRAKKKDEGPSTLSGGGKTAPEPLHPCEYEEYNAVSYGYPLAPTRKVLKPADSLQIDTLMDCSTLTIKIRAINANPVGLRSVTLDPTSVKNAKLTPVDPQRLSDILGRTRIELKVEPINSLQDAEATVIIKDRTGKIWKVYYKYEAEYVTVNPSTELNYGQVTLNTTVSKTVTVTNPLKRPLVVKEIRLAIGTQGYTITSTTPDGPAHQPTPVPVTLQPGESITVDIAVTPVLENQDYVDTLKVILGCTKVPLPLITQTVKPIIYVSDLPFGTFVKGVDGPKTLPLEVCNIGGGQLRFTKPGDADPTHLLEWLASMGYTVDPAEITMLKDLVLGKNQCVTLHVTFDPNTVPVGYYQVTARFWASTREQRDTSVWTARVVRPGGKLSDKNWDKQWLTAAAGLNCTKDAVPLYDGIIYLTNTLGTAKARVKSIALLGQDATDGFFRLDNIDRATSIQPGDEVAVGDSLRQKVQFIPTTERSYAAQLQVVTETGDTLYGQLLGTGIESHGSITGIKYDTVVYNNPYPGTPSQRKMVYVTAKQTRPLTITDIQVLGVDAGNFWVDPADKARLPETLQPGETDSFHVEFRAQASGDRTAKIVFVGDHSFCDDSTNTLTVYTFTRGVVTRGYNFGDVLTCDTRDSSVSMINTGTEPVTVNNVTLDDKTTFFSMQVGAVPFVLLPGESRSFAVHFEPGKVGKFTAVVRFDVVGQDNLPVRADSVLVQGNGYILTVHAHIDNGYRGHPGATIATPVKLDEALDNAHITKFFIGVLYNNKMMRLVNGSPDPADIKEMLKGTLVENWNLSIVESDHPEGEYLAVLTSPDANTYLKGTGSLLNPNFQLYLGSVDSAKLNFYMLLVGKQCARVIPTPGLARIDSVCGLNLRLIESTGFGYALDQNKPNPFNPTTDITFSLGLDGQTSIVVYDALGRKVATLVDGYMQPGTYAVTWDASAQPSGLYYYRLQSGAWTRSTTMILRK